ncbi:MAG: DNA helicase [Planctomycetaceae bacterium]|nr:MAG: DNA helicase [Planctomycetaceae bacterium]
MHKDDDLTDSQRAAVEHFTGPLLVLAGPGSGKTRVITRRIARLIERGVSPRQIVALTFTNKAAREMAERVERLLPGSHVWVTTFHKFCARLLRDYGEAVGLKPNFSIFDTSDQHQLLKHLLHEEDVDAVHFTPARLAQYISQAKQELIGPEEYQQRWEQHVGSLWETIAARIYPKYQQRLLAANAVDFDDLLMHVARLLYEQPELRRLLDQRFRFILVDEYQDTNLAQYQIVAALSQDEPHLCVTGDPDQSIYGWRGAQIENILRFERDFPHVTVIRLEDNFRSTPQILTVADQLIAHNRRRKAKRLITQNPAGPPVELRLYADARQEAEGIAREIATRVSAGARLSDFAILYRVNALSRSLEAALVQHGLRYQVAAGVAFYERSEIKDLLAYLRLIENPRDRLAFLRIVNVPARGIGRSTLQRMTRWADDQQLSLLEAASRADAIPGLSPRSARALCEFHHLIERLQELATSPVADLLQQVLIQTGYSALDMQHAREEDWQRHENIAELLTVARQYDEQQPGGSLSGFLESASLAQDVDRLDSSAGKVTLMTLHAAKGLEFPVVFIVGLEQNLIPHERALRSQDPAELEEERRLLFVGITRAQRELILTQTLRREWQGRPLLTISSDFLSEMELLVRDCTLEGLDLPRPSELSPTPHLPPAPEPAETDNPSATPDRRHSVSSRARWLQLAREGHPWLTTAAALASGKSDPCDLPCAFRVGMRVIHPDYGPGTVLHVSDGWTRRRSVRVRFDDHDGEQTFVVAHSPLQPLSEDDRPG